MTPKFFEILKSTAFDDGEEDLLHLFKPRRDGRIKKDRLGCRQTHTVSVLNICLLHALTNPKITYRSTLFEKIQGREIHGEIR